MIHDGWESLFLHRPTTNENIRPAGVHRLRLSSSVDDRDVGEDSDDVR